MPRLRPNSRFWSKVDIGREDDCWNWLGSTVTNGYGGFLLDGRLRNAHRVSWILTNGIIASSKVLVCHSCDNRLCCNPKHLFLGSYRDNREYAIRKGRRTEIDGMNNPMAWIPSETVQAIRKLWKSGMTHGSIAELTKVSRPHVTNILNGRRRCKS